MCGSLVVDGGEERGGATHQLVVRLGGAGCDWPSRAWRAEVIGGAGGGASAREGKWKMEMGPSRKGLRHSTTAGLARGLGLELAWAGWLGWGWGWKGGRTLNWNWN